MPPVPKPKTVRDLDWQKAVRLMPCFFHPDGSCQDWTTIGKGPSEFAHLDTKSRDDRGLPMSGACHRTAQISWHSGQETFCRTHGTTKEILIDAAEALYRTYKEGQ